MLNNQRHSMDTCATMYLNYIYSTVASIPYAFFVCIELQHGLLYSYLDWLVITTTILDT